MFQEFVRFSNKDIEQIIKKEMSGDVKNAFYAIGKKNSWLSFVLQLTLKNVTADSILAVFALQFAV